MDEVRLYQDLYASMNEDFLAEYPEYCDGFTRRIFELKHAQKEVIRKGAPVPAVFSVLTHQFLFWEKETLAATLTQVILDDIMDEITSDTKEEDI